MCNWVKEQRTDSCSGKEHIPVPSFWMDKRVGGFKLPWFGFPFGHLDITSFKMPLLFSFMWSKPWAVPSCSSTHTFYSFVPFSFLFFILSLIVGRFCDWCLNPSNVLAISFYKYKIVAISWSVCLLLLCLFSLLWCALLIHF